jgi:hypothetical protein
MLVSQWTRTGAGERANLISTRADDRGLFTHSDSTPATKFQTVV